MKKGIIILVLIAVAVAVYLYINKNKAEETEETTNKAETLTNSGLVNVLNKVNKLPISEPQKVTLVNTALQNLGVEKQINVNSFKYAEAIGSPSNTLINASLLPSTKPRIAPKYKVNVTNAFTGKIRAN